MINLARQIRAQLAVAPGRYVFSKKRDTLLEIAVALETAHKTILDLERQLKEKA